MMAHLEWYLDPLINYKYVVKVGSPLTILSGSAHVVLLDVVRYSIRYSIRVSHEKIVDTLAFKQRRFDVDAT